MLNITLSVNLTEVFPSSIDQFSHVGQRYPNGETLIAAALKNRNVTVITEKKNSYMHHRVKSYGN